MKEINEIRSQIGTLKAKLRNANDRLREAGLRHIGLKIGDRIEVKGKFVAEVTSCDVWPHGIWPVGVKVKKDGTVGHQSAGFIGDNWRKL